jgi:hypothetical protein
LLCLHCTVVYSVVQLHSARKGSMFQYRRAGARLCFRFSQVGASAPLLQAARNTNGSCRHSSTVRPCRNAPDFPPLPRSCLPTRRCPHCFEIRRHPNRFADCSAFRILIFLASANNTTRPRSRPGTHIRCTEQYAGALEVTAGLPSAPVRRTSERRRKPHQPDEALRRRLRFPFSVVHNRGHYTTRRAGANPFCDGALRASGLPRDSEAVQLAKNLHAPHARSLRASAWLVRLGAHSDLSLTCAYSKEGGRHMTTGYARRRVSPQPMHYRPPGGYSTQVLVVDDQAISLDCTARDLNTPDRAGHRKGSALTRCGRFHRP